MHELAITQSIVEIGISQANGRKVQSLTVEIGTLSGVIPESVEFCFEACCRETPLEGTQLIIDVIPGRGRCLSCHIEQDLSSYYESCKNCHSFNMDIISGKELRVKQLEVE